MSVGKTQSSFVFCTLWFSPGHKQATAAYLKQLWAFILERRRALIAEFSSWMRGKFEESQRIPRFLSLNFGNTQCTQPSRMELLKSRGFFLGNNLYIRPLGKPMTSGFFRSWISYSYGSFCTGSKFERSHDTVFCYSLHWIAWKLVLYTFFWHYWTNHKLVRFELKIVLISKWSDYLTKGLTVWQLKPNCLDIQMQQFNYFLKLPCSL